MSFLMPLYIAGAAAVALPVIFHLIRRTPRGQVTGLVPNRGEILALESVISE